MIWDVLNLMVQTVVSAYHAAMNLLPASPILLSSSDISNITGITTYAAFFLPISLMAATLALFIAGIAVWVSVLLIVQLVEAITP